MVGPEGSFLTREILAGCYKQRIIFLGLPGSVMILHPVLDGPGREVGGDKALVQTCVTVGNVSPH
jgi:hypothetical protein